MARPLKEIIANADDFGYDQDSTLATIDCFRAGALTSATIMPKMPATKMAIKFACANPQHAYGVHLTFVRDTLECPVADPRPGGGGRRISSFESVAADGAAGQASSEPAVH